MKKKLRDVMDYLEYEELIKIKKDLTMGGLHLLQLVDSKIRDETKKHDVYCCICNGRLEPYSVNNYTLIFGPEDLRKKASFCAIDCLEYFLKNLKDLRESAVDKGL
ncbi:hypothetical protein HY488_01140 [Candidatus Woesearchaeota archaeon]|nr:hypothetical protein [Candidatus Woesearchaeota archaeon]